MRYADNDDDEGQCKLQVIIVHKNLFIKLLHYILHLIVSNMQYLSILILISDGPDCIA